MANIIHLAVWCYIILLHNAITRSYQTLAKLLYVDQCMYIDTLIYVFKFTKKHINAVLTQMDQVNLHFANKNVLHEELLH